jgi:hypothetical protein
MKYTKPQIQVSGKALTSIQRTRKGGGFFADNIDPLNPRYFLTPMAYEADE